jgi:hypothetical protein
MALNCFTTASTVSQPSVLRILHLYANNLVEKLWQRIEAEFSEQAAEGEVQQMLFMFFISQYVVTLLVFR